MDDEKRPTTDEQAEPHFPQNRATAESKLRRDKRHCPVCLAPLGKNAARTRLLKFCRVCQAHPSLLKRCAKCQSVGVWESKQAAACQSCGHHGKKRSVIATDAQG